MEDVPARTVHSAASSASRSAGAAGPSAMRMALCSGTVARIFRQSGVQLGDPDRVAVQARALMDGTVLRPGSEGIQEMVFERGQLRGQIVRGGIDPVQGGALCFRERCFRLTASLPDGALDDREPSQYVMEVAPGLNEQISRLSSILIRHCSALAP